MKVFIIGLLLAISSLIAAAQPPCTPVVTLSGNITSDVTLLRTNVYQVSGCVQVTNNATLTIQDGTVIEFVNNSILMIREDGFIDAIGTAGNPIIMTSGVGSPGSRTVATNAGFVIAGHAPINIGATLGLPCSETLTVDSIPGSNSGTVQYVQMHFLGGINTSLFEAAFTLAGVGSGTILENIQVTNAARSGIHIIGGAPVLTEIVTQDNFENGMFVSYGAQVQLSGYLENRHDPNAHHANGSWGIRIENNIGNALATPITHFYMTNGTILGPAYCNTGSLSSDFKDGIIIRNNANAEIYNSVIAGSRGNGLYLDGADVIAKTATNDIQFSYNSFYNNGANFDALPSSIAPGWAAASGCETTMALWLNGGSDPTCRETNNQLNTVTVGYNESFCGNYCGVEFSPDFVLTEETDLTAPDVFTSIYDERGAVQFDNLFEWITVCPQNAVYCTSALLKAEAPKVSFAPNPATHSALATFEADAAGKVNIAILDKVTGAVLRNVVTEVREPGEHQVQLSVSGLKEGVYTVRVQMKSQVLYGQLVVR